MTDNYDFRNIVHVRQHKWTSKALKFAVVLAAVSNDGYRLCYASQEFKRDKEIVLAAVSNYGLALQYASVELRNNVEVVLTAVYNYGLALQYASVELKRNRNVVLAAVLKNGLALVHTFDELQNDKEVVLTAVSKNGLALEYASKKLQADKEVVLTAIKQHNKSLEYASKELIEDKKFLIECYRNNKNSVQFNDFIKEFDNLENGIYNNNIFMKENADILNLVNNNKEQFYDFLFKNNKYDIIYENEEIAEYIKDKYKIVIFSINDIKPIADDNTVVTEEEIKQKYSNNLFKINPKLTAIFIE